jgi:glyceraldehyde-3-phosphate dehydrogenase (NADP+)
MSQAARIAAMEQFVVTLKESRAAIVDVLMWEICKTTADAAKEFDRTMECKATNRSCSLASF